MSERMCSLDGCDLRHVARGFCNAHYKRFNTGKDLSAPLGTLRPKGISLVRDEHGRKRCIGCAQWLSEDSFPPHSRNHDGLYSHCRRCHRIRKRLDRYGLTASQLRELLDSQGGRCAACGTAEPGGHGEWHIDHDHRCCPTHRSCGACIRGLLCPACNSALGYAKDDPAVLRALADYLERTASMDPMIRYVDEHPLLVQPLPPAEPKPCAFQSGVPS